MASAHSSRSLLLGLLTASVLATATYAGHGLGMPKAVAAGRFAIRPPAGLLAQDPTTPGIEAFFVGEIGGAGSASVLVMYLPGSGGLPASPAGLDAYAEEVVAGLENGELVSSRMREAGDVDLEMTLDQFVGGELRRMHMLQRQVPHDGGLFTLTGVCLADKVDEVAPVLRRSLSSFRSTEAPPSRAQVRAPASPITGNPAALVAAASQAMAEARLAEAVRLAEGVGRDAPFLQQVGALRIRLAANLALGRQREAREVVPLYMHLWREDTRPFSAHYSAMLRRGLSAFLLRLHEQERSKLDSGARAALGQVALTAWAGPAEMVPPRITEHQDQFFAVLRAMATGQGGTWQAIEPALQKAAAEVEGFLRKAAAAGTVLQPSQADYQWLESSLFLPLVDALRDEDPRRYQEILKLFAQVGPSPEGLPATGGALQDLAGQLSGKDQSFVDMAYRIWETSGTEVYARTRALLDEEGLVGLVRRSAAVMGTAP